MIMFSKKLHETLLEEFGKRGLEDIEIPLYIKENLSKELRIYQEKALKYYYANVDSIKQNHLMFNMATGSGKTLIMAALILDCYKRGYRDFIFFVNSNSILEKTKANFADKYSSKYLFKSPIIINEKQVEINLIENLSESKKGAINVYFNTIQGLYSLFTNERENAFTLEDLKGRKFVFLADEAHHLNADTKKKLSTSEQEDKEGWEGMMNKAFKAHKENIMLEFSATLPKDSAVQSKYQDKIIFEYALKEFYTDRFSKKIFLLKYAGLEKEERFLGSMIASLYRQYLAKENGVFLKPVVLYKSKTIKESKDNELEFKEFVKNLSAKKVQDFFKAYTQNEKEKTLFDEALEFFKGLNIDETKLCEIIKLNFSEHFILNVNDSKEANEYQLKLNSLEDKDNEIRVIFAVDKLNEGWDVLNLFDIVRLNTGNINESTKEAQLIGRGARYFPFTIQGYEESFKRKFDDESTSLKALERLSYHAASENEYILRLSKELDTIGLPAENEKEKIVLKIKEAIKNKSFYKEAIFATNSRRKQGKTLFNDKINEGLKERLARLEIPLFEAKGIKEWEFLSELEKEQDYDEHTHKDFELKNINERVFLKAMNILGEFYHFENLAKIFKIDSRREFVRNFLQNTLAKIHKKQNLNSPQAQLKIALFVCEAFKDTSLKFEDSYTLGSWEAKKLESYLKDREIYREAKDKISQENGAKYEWFVYEKFVGSSLESEFLDFIEQNKALINKHFKEWLVVRNERMAEFAVYDDREYLANGEVNEHYADRFEPDFYFLGKRKNDEFIITQCLIEPKGEHLELNDKWKEEFLLSLTHKARLERSNLHVEISGLEFFKQKNKESFRESFETFVFRDKS